MGPEGSKMAAMKITDVERIVVDVPFHPRPAEWTAREVYHWTISEVIRVTTDAGLVGWGETILFYTWGQVSDDAIARVLGRNPAEFLGDDSLGPGLQMAIYDVMGKALGVPCHALFGRKVRDWCPISWWGIDMPPEAYAAEARDALAQGYLSMKIKHRPWFDIVETVRAICEGVPAAFKLDSDANQFLLNAGNAVPVLQKLEQFDNVAIFESPILHRDIEGNRQIRAKISRPLAFHFGEPPFFTALREEVCDGFVIGGGVASVLRNGALAAAAEKPFWLQMVGTGLTTTFALHLGAVLTHAQWPAVTCVNMYTHHLLRQPITVEGGCVRVPQAPGLGVDVDEDALERFRMPEPHRKPKPRLLLTVSWPDGRRVSSADIWDAWRDFGLGNYPAYEAGARMDVRPDDGSLEWSDLYNRAIKAPVRSATG